MNRSTAVFLILCFPLLGGVQAGQAPALTAWDAELQGEFGGLVVRGEDVLVDVVAESLILHVYESPLRVRTSNVEYWNTPTKHTVLHQDAVLVARSGLDGHLVGVSDGATFTALSDRLHVEPSVRQEIQGLNITGDQPQRRTDGDLVSEDAAAIVIQGDFRFGVDQFLVTVRDAAGQSEYDTRDPNPGAPVDVAANAVHVVVEAHNATLRINAPSTPGGGLYYPSAMLQARYVAGASVSEGSGVVLERTDNGISMEPVASSGVAGTTVAGPSFAVDMGLVAIWSGALVAFVALAVLFFWWQGPRFAKSWAIWAAHLLDQGRDTLALAATRIALFFNPEDDYTWMLRGDAFDRLHKWKKSLYNYDRAYTMSIDPEEKAAAAIGAARASCSLACVPAAGKWMGLALKHDPSRLKDASDDPVLAPLGIDPTIRALLGLHEVDGI